jgi:multiple sugar transport system permease protein
MKLKSSTFLFLLPWILTLLLFWLFPLIYSFILSLAKYSVISGQIKWIGFSNYLQILKDNDFWIALKNTSIFVIGTIPFTTIIALLLAILVNWKIPLRGLFRAGFFVPSITSMVVIALIFTNLYAKNGYLSFLCQLAGLSVPENGWLFSTVTALPSIMLMDIWMSIGYYMLLFLAALQAIPLELYQSADIFGANPWQKFWHITLPYLRPMTLFVVLINTIKSFQIFVEIFVMTKGGPLNSTLTMVYLVYDEGLHKFNMGYASAMAYCLFLIIAIFSLAQLKLFSFGKGVEE